MSFLPFSYTAKPGVIAAIEAAGITIVNDAKAGWLASDPARAEAIIADHDPVPTLKAAKLEALEEAYAGKLDEGRVYKGKTYQIDPASQSNIAAKAVTAIAVLSGTPGAEPWPDGFYWIPADNSHAPMDAAAMYAFAQDVGTYVTLLILTRRALKDAIAGAASPDALDAIDLVGSWPANA